MNNFKLNDIEISKIINLDYIKYFPSHKHVAVLMGGWSSERLVSLWSGEACANALENIGYKVTRVDVDKNIVSNLKIIKPNVCFNALHGLFGEDGTIQGLLEILGIPYTHSNVLSSSMAMDKSISRKLFKTVGIPVAEGKIVNIFDVVKKHVMKPPYVIKPISGGSSFGVFIIKDEKDQLPKEIISLGWNLNDNILVEKYIDGYELTCTVINGVALTVTNIVPRTKFYNFTGKYTKGSSLYITPAKIKLNIYKNIMRLSVKAYKVLRCRSIVRVDWRYNNINDKNDELVCLEVNTQPGMTKTSLTPKQAYNFGISFEKLVMWITENAKCKDPKN